MKTKFDNDFEAWYYNNRIPNNAGMDISGFYLLHPSEQFGVYQDFGDSVGISMHVEEQSHSGKFGYYINQENCASFRHDTRQEARQAAIDKFKDWYNEK